MEDVKRAVYFIDFMVFIPLSQANRHKWKHRNLATLPIGANIAMGGGTMNMVLTRDSEPRCESNLLYSRLVAAAGPLLNYWTDFGRLIT